MTTSLAGPEVAFRVCPLCGRNNAAEANQRPSRGPWHLKACRRCAFVYLENAPAYSELEDEFEWSRSLATETERRRKEEPLLHTLHVPFKRWWNRLLRRDKLLALARQFISPGAILDVGCGSGRRLLGLPAQYTLYGIEVSRLLAAEANRHFSGRGGTAFVGPALQWLDELEPRQFSGVIMRAFLEHEVAPRTALAAAHRVLRENGHLIIKVPNYASLNRLLRGSKWCGFRFPDHVNYFTPRSLVTMLRQTGFSIAQFRWLDQFPTSDNMWLVAQRSADSPGPSPDEG
jgi:SAM-dependent methyltransferase